MKFYRISWYLGDNLVNNTIVDDSEDSHKWIEQWEFDVKNNAHPMIKIVVEECSVINIVETVPQNPMPLIDVVGS